MRLRLEWACAGVFLDKKREQIKWKKVCVVISPAGELLAARQVCHRPSCTSCLISAAFTCPVRSGLNSRLVSIPGCRGPDCKRPDLTRVSSGASPMQCPVLKSSGCVCIPYGAPGPGVAGVSYYAFPTQCPVLTSRMALPVGCEEG
eukprot:1732350-Rhodomonas_salina.1